MTGGEGGRAAVPDGLLDFAWLEDDKKAELGEDFLAFTRLLVAGTIENIEAVDGMIRRHLQHWDFSRLTRVDRAILRMSVYTLMFQSGLSPSIVIDEAIGISREFGEDDAFRFLNGVLDGVRKTLEEPERKGGGSAA